MSKGFGGERGAGILSWAAFSPIVLYCEFWALGKHCSCERGACRHAQNFVYQSTIIGICSVMES